MKVTPTWILVSDGTEATIYKYNGPKHKLTVIDGAIFSHINEPTSALTASERGRASQTNIAPRSNTTSGLDSQEHEKQKFARELAQFLEQQDPKFERLILAAPPKMLGYLRDQLSKNQLNKTIATIDKNLTNATELGLEKHLQNVIHIDVDRNLRM